MWMLLTPREVEIVMRPLRGGANAALVARLQAKLDALKGDLELTDYEIAQVYRARQNWRDGYEHQLQAVLDAMARH